MPWNNPGAAFGEWNRLALRPVVERRSGLTRLSDVFHSNSLQKPRKNRAAAASALPRLQKTHRHGLFAC
jgi:hypothetical protein